MVAHPHGGGKDAVVLGVVLEEVLELGGEGVVGLQLDETQAFAQRVAPLAVGFAVHQLVHLAHEGTGVEAEGVVALLELVQFLHHGHGNHNVVVLELPDGGVVVQDNVGV